MWNEEGFGYWRASKPRRRRSTRSLGRPDNLADTMSCLIGRPLSSERSGSLNLWRPLSFMAKTSKRSRGGGPKPWSMLRPGQ